MVFSVSWWLTFHSIGCLAAPLSSSLKWCSQHTRHHPPVCIWTKPCNWSTLALLKMRVEIFYQRISPSVDHDLDPLEISTVVIFDAEHISVLKLLLIQQCPSRRVRIRCRSTRVFRRIVCWTVFKWWHSHNDPFHPLDFNRRIENDAQGALLILAVAIPLVN